MNLDADSVLISHAAAEAYQAKLDQEKAEKEAANAVATAGIGAASPGPAGTTPGAPTGATGTAGTLAGETTAVSSPTHFYGTTDLDPVMAAMDFSKVVEEVVQHFSSQMGVDVTISVEINARSRNGFDQAVQRTIKENCGVLKFNVAEFD